MRYISVECEYFSAKFVPNPALLPELFLSEAMSFHSGGVDEQGKGQGLPCLTAVFVFALRLLALRFGLRAPRPWRTTEKR